VRDLEGALRRVLANAQFTGAEITIDFAKEALHDLISPQPNRDFKRSSRPVISFGYLSQVKTTWFFFSIRVLKV
jgi:hypothetical protein